MELRRIELRLERSENLPVLPAILYKCLELAQKQDTAPKEFERLIHNEPGIAAKVLKIANSAAYSSGTTVDNLTNAISVIGFTALKSLLVSLAFQATTETEGGCDLFNQTNYWVHSIATAVASKLIAKSLCPDELEIIYLAGLLHDIGYLALNRFDPGDLGLVIRKAQVESISLYEAEETVMGWHHTDIGKILAEKWNLGELITGVIEYHHSPTATMDFPLQSSIVSCGDTLACKAGFYNHSDKCDHNYNPDALGLVGFEGEYLDSFIGPVQKEVIGILEVSKRAA